MIVSVVLIMDKKDFTIDKELRDFSVKDTSTVNKIFMVEKSNNKVLLEKKDGVWWVNDKFKAREDAIYTLLKTLYRMDVKSPVPKSAHNSIIKRLATESIKVEIYQNNELSKVIYVGGATSNHFGTYMMLEGSDVAFVVHIPGFNGYLSTRFFTDENLWRSTKVFDYNYNEISTVSVTDPSQPEKSYMVSNNGDNRFDLKLLKENRKIENFDTLEVKTYLAYFKSIAYQSLLPDYDKRIMDSIITSTPYFIIELTDIYETTTTVKAFLMPATYDAYDPEGNRLSYDPNVMYALINNKDFVTIQFYVFDPLFKEFEDFLKAE